jgi:Agrobacterium tumefaciens protein Atu4866
MIRTQLFVLALLAGSAFVGIPKGNTEMIAQTRAPVGAQQSHPYVGMWVTADGHIRHNLLPNGRYDEARGNRESAYQGRYEIRGNDIFYWDDTGFTADGKFVDGVLYHAGMVLYRKK